MLKAGEYMKLNKLLLSCFSLLMLSSCQLIPGISNESSTENSDIPISEEVVSEEPSIKYDLALISDFNISQEDVIAKAVVSGPLKDAGCYEVIEFTYQNKIGYLYSCETKGFRDGISFKTGIYDNKFLGYKNISHKESIGAGLIEKLETDLALKPSIDSYIIDKTIYSGVTYTRQAIIKCFDAIINHYLNNGNDGSIYGDPMINYQPSVEPTEQPTIEQYLLQEYGLILQEEHQIKEVSNEKHSHIIYDSSNNEIAYVYKISKKAQIDTGHHPMNIDIICYVAINKNDNSIYSIAIESATTKNYGMINPLREEANNEFAGKTLEEINNFDFLVSGATYSSRGIKTVIIEAFSIHNS